MEADVEMFVAPPTATTADAQVDIELLKSIPKAFAIDCEDHANWLIKKVAIARAYAARVKEWADQELRRAEREECTLLFLFGRQAEQWARTEIEKLNGRRRSLSLPAGLIGFRKVNASLVIDDEDAVLDWARNNCPGAVITTPKLSRSILKEHFETAGEVPDVGAHIEPTQERFFIR